MCRPSWSGWGSEMHRQAFAAIALRPVLPLWLLAALGVLAVLALVAGLLAAGARRAAGARWPSPCPAGSGRPARGWCEETREDLPDIGLLVVDQLRSDAGRRPRARWPRRRASRSKPARRELPDLEIAHRRPCRRAATQGTRLFAAIERALADIPRARLAGIIAHHRRAGARRARRRAGRGAAPCADARPSASEADRRLRVIEAPGFGIVGRSVDTARRRRGPRRAARRRRRPPDDPPRRRAARIESVPVGREHRIEMPITRAGPTVVELAGRGRCRARSPTLNNRAVVDDQRRARPAARAAGLRRAACRRAHLAPPAEGRSRRSTWCTSPSCARRRRTT